MSETDFPSADTLAVTALISALILQLVQNEVLSLQDAQEVFDAAFVPLEERPHAPETARMRAFLEHAVSGISALAVGRTPRR